MAPGSAAIVPPCSQSHLLPSLFPRHCVPWHSPRPGRATATRAPLPWPHAPRPAPCLSFPMPQPEVETMGGYMALGAGSATAAVTDPSDTAGGVTIPGDAAGWSPMSLLHPRALGCWGTGCSCVEAEPLAVTLGAWGTPCAMATVAWDAQCVSMGPPRTHKCGGGCPLSPPGQGSGCPPGPPAVPPQSPLGTPKPPGSNPAPPIPLPLWLHPRAKANKSHCR